MDKIESIELDIRRTLKQALDRTLAQPKHKRSRTLECTFDIGDLIDLDELRKGRGIIRDVDEFFLRMRKSAEYEANKS